MEKKLKKYVSFILTAVLLICSAPVSASDTVFCDEEKNMETEISDPTGEVGENSYDFSESDENMGTMTFSDASEENPFGDGEQEDLSPDQETGENEEDGLLAGEVPAGKASNGLALNNINMSDNRNMQDYSTWASPVYSYLTKDNSRYMKLEYVEGQIRVEWYDFNLMLQSQKNIPVELSYFGGFYEGSSAYYLVFGENNINQNDSAEVVRVVKYDKNWNRLGQASLRGANTTVPFYAGSLRMAECGEYLYIRTCHQMYTSSDGLNHQANLMVQVRTTDMSITDSYYNVMNIRVGYVSHSFNQFIMVDDQANLIALDHGDAYPRGAVLGKYQKKAGESTFKGAYFSDVISNFQGPTGLNYTGASLGGLEYSGYSYLTAGNSVLQDNDWAKHSVRNIFVTATPRSACTQTPKEEKISDGVYSVTYPLTQNQETSFRWITNYTEGGSISASTPILVKLNSDTFLLLWAQMQNNQANGKISYVFLDGLGNATSPVYTQKGYLSDCKPVVSGGMAVWYVTDGEKLTFYKVKADGSYETEVGHLHSYEPKMKFKDSELTCGLIEKSVKNPLTTNSDGTISYSSNNENIATVDSEGNVKLKNFGTCTITASAQAGINYAAKSVSYTLNVISLKEQVINVPSDKITKTYGDSSFSLNASCLGRAKLNYSCDNKNVLNVSDDGMVSIVGRGTASITITAERTQEYIGASLKVTVTVNRKPIKNCQLIFTKVGSIPSDPSIFEKYLALYDGDKILTEGKDYEFWGSSWSMSGNTLISLTQDIEGKGNYTGSFKFNVEPITQTTILNSARITSKGIQLNWLQEKGAIGYCIYRKIGNENYKLAKKIENRDIVKWTDTEMKNQNQICSYSVCAYTINQKQIVYATRSAQETIVPTPVLTSAVSTGYNSVKITWNAVPGAKCYKLYYKVQNAKSWKTVKSDITGTSYVHSGLTTGTAYSYTVRAVYGNSISGYYKNGISAKPVPGNTTILSVKKYGNGLKVTYKKVSGASGYVIQRSDGTKWTTIATTGNLSYVDTKANKKGVSYKYRVRAYRNVNGKKIYGSYSAIK